jgi:hypothetical protein
MALESEAGSACSRWPWTIRAKTSERNLVQTWGPWRWADLIRCVGSMGDGRCKMPMLLRYYRILFAPSVCVTLMVGPLTKVGTNPAERAAL